MEDKNFWDELAKRLREEQPQPFPEEDWAAVHRRLRIQGKRRLGWFWPVLIGLFFLGNNLIWFMLHRAENHREEAILELQRDTVFLIRERMIHDTVWQRVVQNVGIERGSNPRQNSGFDKRKIQTTRNAVDEHTNIPVPPSEKSITPALSGPEFRAYTVNKLMPQNAIPPLSSSIIIPGNPSRLKLVSTIPVPETQVKRTPSTFLAADAGNAWFLPNDSLKANAQQIGTTLHIMPGKWGVVAGFRSWNVTENSPQTASKLALPDECENCPTIGYPDLVRLHWTEFQLGVAYQLRLPNAKTSLYFSAMGHLRGRITQYQHFRFDQYGGPTIEVEDRYQQKSGLYWNGWNGKISAVHRLIGSFGLYGSVEGRWPAGVNPSLTPPSLGLNLGLAWYFRN